MLRYGMQYFDILFPTTKYHTKREKYLKSIPYTLSNFIIIKNFNII